MRLISQPPQPPEPPATRLASTCKKCQCVWDIGHEDLTHKRFRGYFYLCGRCKHKNYVKNLPEDLKQHAKTK